MKYTRPFKILGIVGIVICLLLVLVMKKYNDGEDFANIFKYDTSNFSPEEPIKPEYYGPTYVSQDISDGSTLYQHPIVYPHQYYPKVPYYPRTGMSCNVGECGATSSCVDNVCVPNKTDKTVFDITF